MSEVGNFSIHGSEKRRVLARVLIKGKLTECLGLTGTTLSELSAARPVQPHVGFGALSSGLVLRVWIGENGDWQSHVLFTVVLLLRSPLPPSFFLSGPFHKSQISDAWEGTDLLFQNYWMGSDPR